MSTLTKYTSDSDLLKVRPNIHDFGVADWTDKQVEAFRIINRDLDVFWYRNLTRDYFERIRMSRIDWTSIPFDPDKLLNYQTQIIDLAVYKALELIYEYLAKEDSDCPFAKLRDYYAKKYNEELKNVIACGLDYDWNSTGTIESSELAQEIPPRTIERI